MTPEGHLGAGQSRPRFGRKLVAIAGAIGCTVALAAVLAAGATAQSSTSKSKPWCHPGKLTVTVFNFSEIPFKGALAGFRKYCPSVKVSYAIQTTSPTYLTALQTQKLSGNLTDIIETYDSLAPPLEVAGLVKSLTPYLNAKDFYPARYWLKGMSQSYIPPPGSQPRSFVGQQFFVPIEADATVFYVNLKDLAAAHFTISPNAKTSVTASGGTIGNDWTWQQAETVWSALSKGSTYGVCERPDWQAQWNPFIKAEGETAMGTLKPNLNGPGALSAWELLIDPLKKNIAIPFATLQKNGDQCDPSFISGAAAMSIGVRGDLPSLQAALGAKSFDILPIPTITTSASGVVRPTGGGSVAWGLSTGVKNTVQALDFLHYFYSPVGYAAAELTYGIVPAVTSIAANPNAIWARLPNNPANNGAYTIAANSVQAIAPQAPGSVYSNSQTNIPNAIQAVLGGTSLSSAMDSLQSTTVGDYKAALIPKPKP
jgi:ABC-type glycerol-3-phosphate transport system substrate-binding protein